MSRYFIHLNIHPDACCMDCLIALGWTVVLEMSKEVK